MKHEFRKCYYCGLPMRDMRAPKEYFRQAFGLEKGVFGKKSMRFAVMTDEHLIKREHGGGRGGNIVKAHMFCNSSRGDRKPSEHKKWIEDLLKRGEHPLRALNK